MAHQIYRNLIKGLVDGSLDLDSDTLKILLVKDNSITITTSAIGLSSTISGTDTNEVSGTAYSTGGKTLTIISSAGLDSSNTELSFISASDVTWNSSTISAGGAIIYKTGSSLSEGIPLFYYDFGVGRSSFNADFRISFDSDGLLTLSQTF